MQLSGPSVYKAYLGAAERLGLGGDAASYWWVFKVLASKG